MGKPKKPPAAVSKEPRKEQDWTDQTESPTEVCSVATDFTPKSITWLWKHVISAAALTFLDGDPGTGKSSIAFDLGARVTRGRTMPDGSKGIKAGVLFLIGEDDAETLAIPRLIAAGADLSKVAFFGKSPDGKYRDNPRFPQAADALAKRILQHKARLVVMDPYMSFLAPGMSPYNEQDVREALGPVGQVAQQTGSAILMIRHPTKNSSQKKIYRGGGSVGITAIARTVLWVAEHPTKTGECLFQVIKSNLAAKPPALAYSCEVKGETAVVRWRGEADDCEDDPVSAAEVKGKRIALEDAQRLIKLALSEGPKPAKTLLQEAEDSGIGRRTLMEAKSLLEVKSKRKVDGSSKAFWEWTLPKK